jgi:hypothetical protein
MIELGEQARKQLKAALESTLTQVKKTDNKGRLSLGVADTHFNVSYIGQGKIMLSRTDLPPNDRDIIYPGLLIYPLGGWTPEVPVFSTTVGKTVEYTVDVPRDVKSVKPPKAISEVVGPYTADSVYNVTAEDGLMVSPYAWLAAGGHVSAEITVPGTMKITVTGPNVPIDGMKIFGLCLSNGHTRYSSLRVVAD